MVKNWWANVKDLLIILQKNRHKKTPVEQRLFETSVS